MTQSHVRQCIYAMLAWAVDLHDESGQVHQSLAGKDLRGKAEWEGTEDLLFSYGLDPSELPEGTPANVTAAVTRLVTQAAADLRTFSEWLHAGEGLS